MNEAFTSKSGQSFRQTVLVEFPRPGLFSIGFVTGTDQQEVQARTQANVITVFVPTTPNPTTGFLIMVPEDTVTKLDMSVADGLKFLISLGSVIPAWSGPAPVSAPVPAPVTSPPP